MFFFSSPYTVFTTFYYEADHRKCEITIGGWNCCLRLFKPGRPLHTGFAPRSLAWLACYTGQSATTYTTVAVVVVGQTVESISSNMLALQMWCTLNYARHRWLLPVNSDIWVIFCPVLLKAVLESIHCSTAYNFICLGIPCCYFN